MRKLSFLLILFICIFQIKAQSNQKTLKGNDFQINYPEQWEVNQSGLMGSIFFIFSPLDDSTDKFRENINLVKQDLSGIKMSLDDFVILSEKQLKTIITDAKIIQSKRITKNNNEHHLIILEGKQGFFHLKTMQYYWINDNKAYILTFTAEADKFDNYFPKAKKIMDSFKILK